ncbi:MAG: hypothetical protein JWM92_610 [Candidatus Nomurabacteria bacterium]|nr:hypothetical protein [Candidatus Nomurabacteria bacterium]
MPDEIDHIAELEKRLYARDPENVPKRTFGILRPVRQNVTSTWGETTIPNDKKNHAGTVTGYRRFFIFSFIFFLIALGGAAFSFYRGALTLSSKNVDVSILGNAFVAAGSTLPLQVEIANSNSAGLLNAKVAIDYPKGATDPNGNDTVHTEQVIGTIAAGQTKSQDFSIMLYGQQGTTQTITATLSYSLQNSSAVFQKQTTFAVTISSSPLALTVTGPDSIAANQPFELTINNAFTGDTPLSNAITRVEYPSGFVFASATPAPTGGNNVWALGDLENGTNRTITIKGKLAGQENEQKSFRVYVGTPVSATDTTIATVYNSALHTFTLAQPFIAAQLNLNGQSTDVAAIPVGDAITGNVSWSNTSALTITNPTFTVSLAGTSVDTGTVTATNGYYDPTSNTMTWTADSNPALASLAPGQTGQLAFSFSPKKADTSDIGVHLSVQGTFPDNNNAQQSISDIDVKTIRFSGHLQFASQAFYSVGPIKNTGPFPPKAGQTTSYTVTWTARPSENSLTNVTASAVLPLGVTWAGVISPQSEPVNYSPDTRTVTWNVGVLPKATSVPQIKTVSFQLTTKPTASQIGQSLPLLGETTIVGTDTVVNAPLTITRSPLTTSLDSDPVYSAGKERVVP